MNKYLIILLIIVTAALFFFMLKSCNQVSNKQEDIVSSETKLKDSVTKIKDSVIRIQQNKNDSLAKANIILKNKYDSAVAAVNKTRASMAPLVSQIKALQKILDGEKTDTASTLQDYAKLKDDADQLTDFTDQLQGEVDSLVNAGALALAGKDSIIANLQAQVKALVSYSNQLQSQLTDALGSEKKYIRKNKIANTLTEISTILAGVISTLLILKK